MGGTRHICYLVSIRARLVEGSSTKVSARSCRFPVDKCLKSRKIVGLLRLTCFVQINKGLLQPGREQSCSLRGLAFIQKAQQGGRLVDGEETLVVGTDRSFEIDQCECLHGTGVDLHILSEIVNFEFVCATICRI